MHRHLVSFTGVLLFFNLFKVSKMSNYYDLFKVSKMTTMFFDLFKVIKMTVLIMTSGFE